MFFCRTTTCRKLVRPQFLAGTAFVLVVATACQPVPSPTRDAPRTRVTLPADGTLVGLVDPFVGTANEGQTHPGPLVPNGMASVSPRTTFNKILDFLSIDFVAGGASYSGYLAGSPGIFGFGLSQLSGVGCPEFGLPLLVPGSGDIPTKIDDYPSRFTHETAFAGYYGVDLIDHQVDVDLTATPHTGLLRFGFHRDDGYVLVDASNAISIIQKSGDLNIVAANEVEGSAAFGEFCFTHKGGRIYFVVRFDQDAAETGLIQNGGRSPQAAGTGDVAAYFAFPASAGKTVSVQVGVSWTSIAHARMNLDAEATTFDAALANAVAAWEDKLGRIKVTGGSADEQRMFYTALYHTLIHPSIASNVDGSYVQFGSNSIVTDATRDHYTVFSLWDTYRTVHPFLTLAYPELQVAMLRAIADMTLSSGLPPKWELVSDEVQMMAGDPALIVMADSYAKGLTDFGAEQIYPLLVSAASNPNHRPGAAEYIELGYVPMELAGPGFTGKVWGPASTTLEYALADWSRGELAEHLGRLDDAAIFRQRSLGYRTLFDPETGTLRPKNADGSFLTPYDPDEFITEITPENGGAGGPGFVEGSGWQYAFMVPHDIDHLIARHGPQVFLKRLQDIFELDRFVSFNEPDIAYPYLFNFADGHAYETQQTVRRIIAADYGTGAAGLPGNDDTGTLSAWLVFSMMGFYPVALGVPSYQIGSPVFDEVAIMLTQPYHTGHEFKIVAEQASAENVYIQSLSLNGSPLTDFTLAHDAIAKGGKLHVVMGREPAD